MLVDYTTFANSVSELQLELFVDAMQGVRTSLLANDTNLPTYRTAYRQLFDWGIADRIAEGYELRGSEEWVTFDAYANDVGRGYFLGLAKEGRLTRQP